MSRTVDPDAGNERGGARQGLRRDEIAVTLVGEVITALLRWFEDYADRISPPPPSPAAVEELTFADVVRYFSDKHPNDPRVRAGALWRAPHPKGQLLLQVFLDESDEVCVDGAGVPYGRRLIARRLDPELASKFADLDVIIFR